jgi:phenylacetate-coenzyme A ligase PaaK-like adenylate-forming protein
MLWASGFRAWEWAGYRLGDRYATLGGSSLVPSHLSPQKRGRYVIERNLALTSLRMNADTVRMYAEKISKFRPLYLRGYPSSLFILAKYIKEHGSRGITPEAVFTTAEALLPSQRAYLEDAFQCHVFDHYGCRDGGAGAMECNCHSGYHISSEQSLMELIRDDTVVNAGELGEITSTDLYNYAMPFIRYRTGDTAVGTDARCPCGRGLPRLPSIQGRVINLVLHEDGSYVPGLPLTDIFEHIVLQKKDSIRRYQLIQEDRGLMTVKIVRGENYSPEDSDEIISMIRNHVGKNTRVVLDFVDDIPSGKHGKNLFVISKVPPRI